MIICPQSNHCSTSTTCSSSSNSDDDYSTAHCNIPTKTTKQYGDVWSIMILQSIMNVRMRWFVRRIHLANACRHAAFIFYTQIVFMLIAIFVVVQLTTSYSSGIIYSAINRHTTTKSQVRIILITPTYRRATRLADMTRMANTLTHLENLHWIVVEDGQSKSVPLERLLNRTQLPYTYIAAKTVPGYPKRGWYQRTQALDYVRKYHKELTDGAPHAVVYFADDDNSYDIRLFDDYIRKVKKVGIWAVGLVGGTLIELPDVKNGSVVGWHVAWNKKRTFATDMAGFAISLDVILNSTAVFGKSCKRGLGAPETCLLEDLNLDLEDLEPFGFEENPKELLVWHTKTVKGNYSKLQNDTYGFLIE